MEADQTAEVRSQEFRVIWMSRIELGKSEESAIAYAYAYIDQRTLGRSPEYAATYAEQIAEGKSHIEAQEEASGAVTK